MFSLIKKILHIKWRYLLYGSYVYVEPGSTFKHGKNMKLIRSKIHLKNNSSLTIDDNAYIKNTIFALSRGEVHIGNNCFFSKGEMPYRQTIIVSKGSIDFGSFNRIRSKKFWIRFGGKVKTGDYINLNEYSEIRCDDRIDIGSYVEISYNVKIWDTNTHEFEPLQQRRQRWKKMYLQRDVCEKPKTSPVYIGSDSWIGDSVTILKGTKIGNGCICGYGTIISNREIDDFSTITNVIDYTITPNVYGNKI